jgi:thiamine transport system substrate-binding protein
LAVPTSLEDLVKPEYKGLLVVENPATSSPGLAFLLSTIAEFGPQGYLAYWNQLKNNDVFVVNDWNTAYYTNFSGSSGKGPQPMVVSYGTSPAAEVIFANPKVDEAPTGSLVGKNMCFRQIEFIGILKGSKKQTLAEKFVDFMLSKRFQEDIPLNMIVFPVNSTALLPAEFSKYIQIPGQPAVISPDDIAANREKWIEAWRAGMLQ